MKIMTGAPEKDDKYFLKKPWGYNPCILGNPNHRQSKHSVLVNCTGGATGVFNKRLNEKKCKYFGNTNAENYWELAKKQGLERGQEPRDGAMMCWHGNGSKAGHVAPVEKVRSEDKVQTIESGWKYENSYMLKRIREKGDGNWGLDKSEYTFQGFVYHPNIEPYPNPTDIVIKYGDKGEAVKWVQWAVTRAGYKVAIDGKFGSKTEKALKKFQKKYKLQVDGKCGPKTQAKIKSLYTIEE